MRITIVRFAQGRVNGVQMSPDNCSRAAEVQIGDVYFVSEMPYNAEKAQEINTTVKALANHE